MKTIQGDKGEKEREILVTRGGLWFKVWIQGVRKHKMFQEPNNCI